MSVGISFLAVVFASATTSLGHSLTKHGDTQAPVLLPLTQRLQTKTLGTQTFRRNFYIGNVRAGHGAGNGEPQELMVFFDTGSGNVLLDSTRCESIPCLQHHRYSPEDSANSFMHVYDSVLHGSHVYDSDSKGNKVAPHSSNATVYFDMADDSTAKKAKATADLMHDTMCLGSERNVGSSNGEICAEVGFLAATSMSNELFLDAPFDGIVGMSLEGLSVSSDTHYFSRLVAKYKETGSKAQFAMFLPPANSEQMAELAFGGFNPARLAAPLVWLPVVKPELGYWQMRITSVRVGDRTFDLCSQWADGCLGIVDTSSPSLGLPEEVFPELPTPHHSLCEGGPDVVLTIDGSFDLKITSREYMESVGGTCVSQLHPLTSQDRSTTGTRTWNGKVVVSPGVKPLLFILGEPVLRRYYTVFDSETKKVGFGLSASAAGLPDSRKKMVQDEIILLQNKFVTTKTKRV